MKNKVICNICGKEKNGIQTGICNHCGRFGKNDRELSKEWWDFKATNKHILFNEYKRTNFTIAYNANQLNGREIEEIWNNFNEKANKMYTRDEVIELCINAMITGVNIRDKNQVFNEIRDNWIDENL